MKYFKCNICGMLKNKKNIFTCQRCNKKVCLSCYLFTTNVCIDCDTLIYAENYKEKIKMYENGKIKITA